MKKILFLTMVIALFAACNSDNTNENTDTTEISIANFDAVAGDYVDKQVVLTGIVDHVCKHGGKKILLVSDSADVHVDSDERFDEALVGEEITVTGIVEEFRVDEAYCQTLEDNKTNEHSEGEDQEVVLKQKHKQAQFYRDSMKTADVDHLSFYSLKYVSHKIVKSEE